MTQYVSGLLDRGIIRPVEFAKAQNFAEIAELAEKHVSQIPIDPKDRNYNRDWFTRFFEGAGCVSDKDVQEIWARILAGEIIHPSTYNLKTLDVLKNLDKASAELFKKICLGCIKVDGVLVLPSYEAYPEFNQIRYESLLVLDELGLVNSANGLTLNIEVNSPLQVLTQNSQFIITVNKLNKISVNVFPLTIAGGQIAKIFMGESSRENLELFAQLLNENTPGKIGLFKIKSIKGSTIEFDNRNLLN